MNKKYNRPKYYKSTTNNKTFYRLLLFVVALVLIIFGWYIITLSHSRFQLSNQDPTDNVEFTTPPTPAILSDDSGYLEESFVEEPTAFQYSDPKNYSFETQIMDAGEIVSQYRRKNPIRILNNEDYSVLYGITTYKGDNFRSSASFGEAKIEAKKLNIKWISQLDSFEINGFFDGTAQPLVVRWTADMMKYIKFRSTKKDKLKLIEVIFADKSGKVYFFDIDDGLTTRNIMHTTGYTEGTPSLDPRGYPLMYIGQTLQENGNTNKSRYNFFYVYNLITQKRLFRFGSANIEPFSDSKWQGYGSSPLIIHDQVIAPGENGILYTFDLETQFDPNEQEISINTKTQLTKYKFENINTGFVKDYLDEAGNRIARDIQNEITGSTAVYKSYAIFSENSGFLQCVNLSTMKLIYIVPLNGRGDFTVSIEKTPNIEDRFYVYSGTSLSFSNNDSKTTENENISLSNTTYFRQIDGITGEILWQNEYECTSSENVKGGAVHSAIIGKNDLSEYVVYAMSGTDITSTKLVCAKKLDGSVKWEIDFLTRCKSAPIEVYDKQGKGYILFCGMNGIISLIDGLTGEILDQIELDTPIDGDPVIYSDKMIVHLQNDTLICLEIS